MIHQRIILSNQNLYLGFLLALSIYPILTELLEPGFVRLMGKFLCIGLVLFCIFAYLYQKKGKLALPYSIFVEVCAFLMMLMSQVILAPASIYFFAKQFVFLLDIILSPKWIFVT